MTDYFVYTDGSCSNNGKNGAKAGIGIFFKEQDPRNVSRRLSGKQTSNAAEITAIIDVFPIISKDLLNGLCIGIVSDSEYAIKCVGTYGMKCAMSKWSKNIPNKELVRKLYETYKDFPNVIFIHVKAHTNNTDVHSIGNKWADKLANQSLLDDKDEIKPNNNFVELSTKIYLNATYSQKEDVKLLGGHWDTSKKKWFINTSNEAKAFIIKHYT